MPLKGPEPKPGDLIAIKSNTEPYDHWGVYVGDDEVVHIQAWKSLDKIRDKRKFNTNKPTALKDRAIVKREKLKKVAGKRDYRVNNSNDQNMTPDEAETIVTRAKSLVGVESPYNMIGKNCEHFANDVRYGKEFSKQADDAITCLLTEPAWEFQDCRRRKWEKNDQIISSNQATPANPEPLTFIESLARFISNAINYITNLLHF